MTEYRIFWESLDAMHKSVAVQLDSARTSAFKRKNHKTYIIPYKPCMGDYVVVPRMHGPRTEIPSKWVDPRRITQILSDFTVEVEHLLFHKKEIVHLSHFKPSVNNQIVKPAQLQEVVELSDWVWYSVDSVKDVRQNDNEFQVFVSQKGFTSAGDIWQPLTNMFEDVPRMVRAFFGKKRSSYLVKRTKSSIAL